MTQYENQVGENKGEEEKLIFRPIKKFLVVGHLLRKPTQEHKQNILKNNLGQIKK